MNENTEGKLGGVEENLAKGDPNVVVDNDALMINATQPVDTNMLLKPTNPQQINVPSNAPPAGLKRRNSTIDVVEAQPESVYDYAAQRQLDSLQSQLNLLNTILSGKIAVIENKHAEVAKAHFSSDGVIVGLQNQIYDIQESIRILIEQKDVSVYERNVLYQKIELLADQVGASALLDEELLYDAKEQLLNAIWELSEADKAKAVAGRSDPTAKAAQERYDAATKDKEEKAIIFLKENMKKNYGKIEDKLPIQKILGLQHQLEATMLKLNEPKLNTPQPAASWSLRTMFSSPTNKNARAVSSVKKLLSNPAFSGLATTPEAVEINTKIVELMTHATYALQYFNNVVKLTNNPSLSSNDETEGKEEEDLVTHNNNPFEKKTDLLSPEINEHKVSVESVSLTSTSDNVAMDAGTTLNMEEATTPNRKPTSVEGNNTSKSKHAASANKQPKQPAADINVPETTINQVVIDVIRNRLAAIQTETKGLIGTQNTTLQFWGKVLMALALAIAVTLAAVTLMSALGFASPAFLVPYLIAIQANAVVSTVLNFVAAKLTLDLNAAAAVTVAASAGLLGMFGKGLHMRGAPTSLKRDLDNAAQDMEAALKETEAARTTLGMSR